MALPTGTMSGCDMCVELSTDGTSWTDFSDYLTVIDPPEMARAQGEAYVFGEDVAVITAGKREPVEVTLTGVYVDATATTNPFSFVWGQFTTDCGGTLHVRWAPAGCATTNQVFSTATATSDAGEVMSLTPAGSDASDGSPITWSAVVRAAQVYRATYA